MAISVLFLLTSQQIGSTYGDFNDTVQTNNVIGLCEVFPDSIEQLLVQFNEHVNKAVTLKASLKNYISSDGLSGVSGIEGMSLEELEIAEQEVSRQIASLHSNIEIVNEQLAANNQIWNEINTELNAAAAVLVPIGGYINNLAPNCLEIREKQFFNQLQSNLSQNEEVLSTSLKASVYGIIQYLTTINDINSPISYGVIDAVYQQMEVYTGDLLQPFPFLGTLNPPEGNISSELISTYESWNTEMNSFRDTATSGITNLENQQQLISQTRSKRFEEIEVARLEALEKAKKEEEQLALEKKQQQEAEDKAKAEEEAKLAETAPEEINEPEEPAIEPVNPESAEDPTISKDSPEEVQPQEKPLTDAPIPEPTEAPVAPSDPQNDKGGE
ncbi:hypothetical protein [Paenibacillus monticola]|uniref:Uncharacterized protein n=1 Tax=Paenibacillus monticola TaxID=2666075 RepID=A0A7X2L4G7_9BACL|nr:hypothetical protein [Paenibacillus monticola]MRN55341.1 hypothetical protein [Paenibacillus monticola]